MRVDQYNRGAESVDVSGGARGWREMHYTHSYIRNWWGFVGGVGIAIGLLINQLSRIRLSIGSQIWNG